MTPRHTKALAAFIVVGLIAGLVSVSLGSLVGAVSSAAFGVVILFVMGIAWTRFRGEPTEHHAPSDKVVDDTDP